MHMRDFGFGGNMNLSVIARVFTFGVFTSLVSLSALGQSLPAGVTPSMVQQVQNMTPAQQQALAKQYGINLPQAQGSPSTSDGGLGDAGEPLDQASGDDPSADAESQPDDLAGAVEQRDSAVFLHGLLGGQIQLRQQWWLLLWPCRWAWRCSNGAEGVQLPLMLPGASHHLAVEVNWSMALYYSLCWAVQRLGQ